MAFYVFQLNQFQERYSKLLKCMNKYTVYHTLEYLLAEERAEEAPVKIFVYENENEIAMMPNIQRSINYIKGLENYQGFYDIKTPHEYSGVLVSNDSETLYMKYFIELSNYCKNHGIIFHFMRFNPYLADVTYAQKCGYTVNLSNQQTYVELDREIDLIHNEYSSSTQRNLKRAYKNHLKCMIVDSSNENILLFKNMYSEAMKRLEAKPFFYFNDEYFFKLLKSDNIAKLLFVIFEEQVIAASILLLDENFAYYHLGCDKRQFSEYRSMDFLFDSMIKISKNYNKNFLHLGGGHESLRKFKSKFSKNHINYFIGYKIFDKIMYEEVAHNYLIKHENIDKNFLPVYRG